MLKKLKEQLKINIVMIDIIALLAFLISIFSFISFSSRSTLSILDSIIISFWFILFLFSVIYLTSTICDRIKYKIKEKSNLPREYYFKRDINPKDDLFALAVILIILAVVVLLFTLIC